MRNARLVVEKEASAHQRDYPGREGLLGQERRGGAQSGLESVSGCYARCVDG